MNRLFITAALALSISTATAQVLPAENDTLNYRLIGFKVPAQPKTNTYLFEIAPGRINNNEDFGRNIILTSADTARRTILTVPAFGKDYTWRVSYQNKKGKTKGHSRLFHFTTGRLMYIDTAKFRLRIIDTANDNKELLVFRDGSRALYNLMGNPLWFLPAVPGVLDSAMTVRDLKITPQATITFLAGPNACEIDYDGNLLWKAPNDGAVSNDTTEYYHHEFTRLSNGNYMVASHETGFKDITDRLDTLMLKNDRISFVDGKPRLLVREGTLVEYDSLKNVVWSWKSSGYFGHQDLFGKNLSDAGNTHMNAFFFDEKNKYIYVSFRDISRVIKLKYPSGEVVAEYGQSLHGEKRKGNSLFYGQHACRLDQDGNLYLFNNNVAFTKDKKREPSVSYISVFREPANKEDDLQKIWEYSCRIDTMAKDFAVGGGNACELNNKSFLVSMGATNRDFIVTRDKKLIWNAVFEMENGPGTWIPYAGYRSSPIENRAELEQLIFR